jgi:hypothetical protein
LRRELSPFLHQIVARCSLVLKTGLLRHVRDVRRLTTGTDIEIRDLVGGDERGTADGPHELCSPERRLTLRIRIISVDARSVVGRKRRRCQNGQGDNTPVIAFRDVGEPLS